MLGIIKRGEKNHLTLHVPLIKHLPRLALLGAMYLELKRKNKLIVSAHETSHLAV